MLLAVRRWHWRRDTSLEGRDVADTTVSRGQGEGKAIWLLGGLYEVKAAGDETNGTLTVMQMTMPAGMGPPPHTHPGPESGYLLEGEFTLLVDGQPSLLLKAGDSYKVPSGAIHDARSGDKGAKVIATYVVEKGKPLASPAN